jgi:FlaA1/EpsC-like NDP-sugar epimerase|uniref:SDR family NAD(P)-dependent oxidoreductase n=1 Tax=Desulfobacca acetoxidans TaxID=60893 RepID=A0A7C3V3S5_9BACT
MSDCFTNKVVLVTGAAGSVGQELVRQLLVLKAAEVRALDNNETELFFLGERHRDAPGFSIHLGDVRDERKLEDVCLGVDIIIHAAAFKHVGLSEYHAFDAVQTNILGVANVVRAAMRQGVGRVLFTSSDKAVNPANVMGATKLLGERLMTAANNAATKSGQRFASVRFGNVIGSRGSVIPIFAEQIRRGGPVTVTDLDMTRFFMTNKDAVKLVLEACLMACGGEVFVTKMPVMRIVDLAQALIALLAPAYGYDPHEIPIRFVGARSGEKLYEELLTIEEMGRALETEHMFAILPSLPESPGKSHYHYKGRVARATLGRQYSSALEPPMTVDEIKHFLLANHILETLVAGNTMDLPRRHHRHLHPVKEASVGVNIN